MDWIICRLSDLGNPGSLGFVLETPRAPVEGFLVRRGDWVRAYRNSCPHTRAPLEWVPNQFLDSSGELIQCSMHGALFLVESGECVHGPCLGAFPPPFPIFFVPIVDNCDHSDKINVGMEKFHSPYKLLHSPPTIQATCVGTCHACFG